MANEYLQNQINASKPVDTDTYSKLKCKTYYSGRDIQIGDQILFGVLQDSVKYDTDNTPMIDYRVIVFHPDEIGNTYIVDESLMLTNPTTAFLYLKLKE